MEEALAGIVRASPFAGVMIAAIIGLVKVANKEHRRDTDKMVIRAFQGAILLGGIGLVTRELIKAWLQI